MPSQFLAMVRAELRAVFTRGAGYAVLGMGLVVGLLAVAFLEFLKQRFGADDAATTAQAGQMVKQFTQFTAGDAAGKALWARNFFILPMFLLLVTGGSLAGELSDHTLRELLVRPVPRWSVLLAKFLALLGLSAASLVASLLPSLLGGFVLFQSAGPVGDVALGYLASWLSDAGLIAIGLLASTLVRSAGGVVVSVILFLMADLAARGLLSVLGMAGVTGLDQVKGLLPGAALAAWQGWSGDWAWQPFAGLGVLIAVGFGGALLRLQRMDVP